MILASWPSPPAGAFAAVLSESTGISTVVELAPYEAQAALMHGTVDLALIPTFDALRAEVLLDLLPGVGLVGDHSPTQVLAVSSPLDQITSVAFDPRFAQEVLLTQIILKENYEGKPTFSAVDPSISVSERLSKYDAALIAPEEASVDAVVLDLGQEWLELTLRPMVWGLLAARVGEIEVETARLIRHYVRESSSSAPSRFDGVHGYQFTLDGYAQAGLEELTQHMYYNGSLSDFPQLPFIEIPAEENKPA